MEGSDRHVYDLLEHGTFSDCTIVTADHVEIKAHLAYICRSKYFRNAFTHAFREGREKSITLPENSNIVRLLVRGIYLPLEQDHGDRRLDYAICVEALPTPDHLCLTVAANKYQLSTIQDMVSESLVQRMYGIQHDLATDDVAKADFSSFLRTLQMLYCEEDVIKDELRRKLHAMTHPTDLLKSSLANKRAVFDACPAYFLETVTPWNAELTEETRGALCPSCEHAWRWTDHLLVLYDDEQKLHCPLCGKQETWMTYLVHWCLVNIVSNSEW